MNKFKEQTIQWFEKKIKEVYGNPCMEEEILPPKIEYENYEVPYIEEEEKSQEVDAGPATWVYVVTLMLLFSGLALVSFASDFMFLLGLALIGVAILFAVLGRKYIRKTIIKTEIVKITKKRTETRKIEIPQTKTKVITGNWSIKNMGIGNLDISALKLNGNTYLLGSSFEKKATKFFIPVIKNEKSFTSSFEKLVKDMENAPYVLDGNKESFEAIDDDQTPFEVQLCGLEKNMMHHYLEVGQLFSQRSNKTVEAHLIPPKNLTKYLLPSLLPYYKEESNLWNLVDAAIDFDSTCKSWLEVWPGWIKTLKKSRDASIHIDVIPKFIEYSNLSHYSSFNFYCPNCNKETADELLKRDYSVHSNEDLSAQQFSQNTRCFYLIESNAWQCPMCEKITLTPIPVHRALDDILMPVYNNLMEEHKTEREKNYSEVRKKEIHYKNEMKKEVEKMFFDNLNGILELKDNVDKMRAEIDGETEAIQFINESVSRYKKLSSVLLNEIELANETIKHEIAASARQVLEEVDRVKDREMELLNRELDHLAKAKRLEDERRDALQQQILNANVEQNNILNSKFNELINTNKTGFKNVSTGVENLRQTTEKGLNHVADTTRKGFEDQLKTSKELNGLVRQNNAMQAARNEKMGIDPYDDSSILRPGRAIRRGLINMEHKLTGKSSMESHAEKLETTLKKN